MTVAVLLTLLVVASPVLSENQEGATKVLPPVFDISRNTTTRLDVDLFFSLFFVFLNEDIRETTSDFTVFAPAGLSTSEASRWLGAEEQVTEQLLLNHMVLGKHVRPEMVVVEPGPWLTMGMEEVRLELDAMGEFRVNGVRVLAWTEEGPALIVVLEDYLFKQDVAEDIGQPDDIEDNNKGRIGEVPREMTEESKVREESTSEFPEAKPRKAGRNCTKVGSRTGGLSIFSKVVICTETLEAHQDKEIQQKEGELRRLKDPLPNLLDQVHIFFESCLIVLFSGSRSCGKPGGRQRTISAAVPDICPPSPPGRPPLGQATVDCARPCGLSLDALDTDRLGLQPLPGAQLPQLHHTESLRPWPDGRHQARQLRDHPRRQ